MLVVLAPAFNSSTGEAEAGLSTLVRSLSGLPGEQPGQQSEILSSKQRESKTNKQLKQK